MNKYQNALPSNEGFYIPERAVGYYEMTMTINQDDNARNYQFVKGFNFLGETYDYPIIHIKSIFIDDPIKNFERMVF